MPPPCMGAHSMRTADPSSSSRQSFEKKEDLAEVREVEIGKRRVESGEKAKRPVTPNAYIIYCIQHRPRLHEKYPLENQTQISRLLGAEWRQLPNEIKARFQEEAVRLRDECKARFPDLKVFNPDSKRKRTQASDGKDVGIQLAEAVEDDTCLKAVRCLDSAIHDFTSDQTLPRMTASYKNTQTPHTPDSFVTSHLITNPPWCPSIFRSASPTFTNGPYSDSLGGHPGPSSLQNGPVPHFSLRNGPSVPGPSFSHHETLPSFPFSSPSPYDYLQITYAGSPCQYYSPSLPSMLPVMTPVSCDRAEYSNRGGGGVPTVSKNRHMSSLSTSDIFNTSLRSDSPDAHIFHHQSMSPERTIQSYDPDFILSSTHLSFNAATTLGYRPDSILSSTTKLSAGATTNNAALYRSPSAFTSFKANNGLPLETDIAEPIERDIVPRNFSPTRWVPTHHLCMPVTALPQDVGLPYKTEVVVGKPLPPISKKRRCAFLAD
eukprot:CAMPEP_0184667754 /NCGR_PEP_ID=MMETSP0308-20130426/69026_1 /TAXON_ID=38269 /ORGANISM="Gloeochaete witrockiana, Strain SAG 46.84" /LENGTH=488 /DNA_ID=CAMNT_0027113129 /DNA_START=88 /DNA_END=1554 /DNA_ORIENTATION=+